MRSYFFTLQDPFGQLNNYMRIVYTLLTLLPAPLFLVLGIYSSLQTPSICGAFPYEMSLMWFVMCLAHLPPWILRCQQLYFSQRA